MIEHEGKQFYTTYEIKDLINDDETEIHKVWKNKYPNYQNVVLLEQVNRILYEAKKNKKVVFIEYTKTENAIKKYFAFEVNSVIEYIQNRDVLNRAFNIKVIDKE